MFRRQGTARRDRLGPGPEGCGGRGGAGWVVDALHRPLGVQGVQARLGAASSNSDAYFLPGRYAALIGRTVFPEVLHKIR